MVQIDADLTVYGEECTFGLGKVCFTSLLLISLGKRNPPGSSRGYGSSFKHTQ